MEYIKRRYRDVKDTFEYEYSGRTFFIKWTTVGKCFRNMAATMVE